MLFSEVGRCRYQLEVDRACLKLCCSRWHHLDISSHHQLITTFSLSAAILDFRLDFRLYLAAFHLLKTDVLLDFAPPRPSPSSILLSSSKAGEVLGLTPSNWGHGAAEVPSMFSSSCPSFISAAPMWSRSGVGTIVQRNEDFLDYTAGTSLSGRRLLLAFALTKLNFDKEWMTFNDLCLQKLARVSFVSLVRRRPALQQGSWLHASQFRN